ncbi:hypothetical protein A3A45_03860 [Candidatus Daviesbacteria bacterium RIFCSPLOWO2_01_FULL_36_8]|nr:MAG: hypothetical protein A3A45_03860 [Candidatus Daviesbacteria bacterium RIFCSPLOWO2_01_FULL_36_8]
MITAQVSAFKAILAIILLVAALVFPKNIWAASGNVQICQPSSSCTIGEFLYDDSYTPITDADCRITSRYPDGSSFLASVAMTSAAQADGWYSHEFTAPTTLGLYRTEVKCTTSGETLALDKSFEVQTAASTLDSDDVASAVWGYSGRSLTSFGTLIADIWNNATRTLTGVGLSSGQLATQSDVTSTEDDVKTKISDLETKVDKIQTTSTTTTTNVTNVNNVTNQIQNTLEQIINKPTLEQIIDSTTTTIELQTKINETKKITSQINTKLQYIKNKHALKNTDKAKILTETENVLGSIASNASSIEDAWGWPEASALTKGAKSSSTSSSMEKLLALNKKIEKKVKDIELLASSFDSKSSQIDNILLSWDKKNIEDLKKQINSVSKDVASLNKLPKANTIILASVGKNSTERDVKNKALGLKGIIGANKILLSQKWENPLSNTWLELGSIVFKTLITNPSTRISQTVPLKYYLPVEVKKENIVLVDDELSVKFDAEQNKYFVSGEFTLAPGATKTVSVTIDDAVFTISEEQVNSIRKQAEQLSEPLKSTSYFAQGVTLKSDIDVSLDKIVILQKSAITPDEKIRAYREAQIELEAAKDKTDRLKELAASAGSVGTLFGFVGGTQALAVWGLIIIMAAGFVFIVLYMRALRFNEQGVAGVVSSSTLKKDDVLKESAPHHTGYKRHIKFAVILISVGILASFATTLVLVRPANKQTQEKQVTLTKDSTEVLGATEKEVSLSEKVKILVPDKSFLNILSEPSLDSSVAGILEATSEGFKVSSQNEWVKVKVAIDGKDIEGWVNLDFIEKEETAAAVVESKTEPQEAKQFLVIKDTPTGFLRVRATPSGKEIIKVLPGERFELLKESNGWLQISLEDGTLGWVAKQYSSIIP